VATTVPGLPQGVAEGVDAQGALRVRHASGVALVAEVAVNPKEPDFKAAAQALAQAQPQAVIMGTGGTTFTEAVKAVRQTTAILILIF
jgi:hypothetical protein